MTQNILMLVKPKLLDYFMDDTKKSKLVVSDYLPTLAYSKLICSVVIFLICKTKVAEPGSVR